MKNKKVLSVFYSGILDIFGYEAASSSYDDRAKKTVTFTTLTYGGIDYDKLCRLSALLGTSKIFVEAEYDYGYYDAVELSLEVAAREVVFPDLEEHDMKYKEAKTYINRMKSPHKQVYAREYWWHVSGVTKTGPPAKSQALSEKEAEVIRHKLDEFAAG